MVQGPDGREAKVLNLRNSKCIHVCSEKYILHHILKIKITINKHWIDHIIFHRIFQAKQRSLCKRLLKNPAIFWKSSNAYSGSVLLRYCIGGVTLALLGNLGVIFLSYLSSRIIWFFLIALETSWIWKPTTYTLKDYISTSPIVIMTLNLNFS